MVLIVHEPDMRRTVQHPDGTLIVTDPDGNIRFSIALFCFFYLCYFHRVSCAGFAPVSINRFTGTIMAGIQNGTELSFAKAEKGENLTLNTKQQNIAYETKHTEKTYGTTITVNTAATTVGYTHVTPSNFVINYLFNIKTGQLDTRDEELNSFIVRGDGSFEVFFIAAYMVP